MRHRPLLIAALAAVAVFAVPVTSSAQAPGQDSAVGRGGAVQVPSFDFTATSDPLGGSPSGTASFNVFGSFPFSGTVSCLDVDGNRAVIGVATPGSGFAGFFLVVEDNGPAGSGLDILDAIPTSFTPPFLDVVPTDCTRLPQPFVPSRVTSGDIVVHDAPPLPTSKEQCKNGGWRAFGTTFKNQGDCVSFVATGGRNQPANPPA